MTTSSGTSASFSVPLPTSDSFSLALVSAINRQKFDQFTNDSELHTAVRMGDTALLQKLLNELRWQSKVDVEGDYGETPFHLACTVDNLDAAKLLLKYDATFSKRRKCFHELHAVHLAASEGAEKVLRYLLTEGSARVGVSVRRLVAVEDTEGSTALHWAVQSRRLGCVKLLLDAGARVDKQQSKGLQSTPLHMACYQGLLDVMDLMYSAAKPDYLAAVSLYDGEGLTALHRAAILNAVSVITFIVEHGCDVDIPDRVGRTAAHLGAATESWEAMRCLVDTFGADPYRRDPMGRTCLHAAALSFTFPPQMERIWSKREPSLPDFDMTDIYGFTALHYAALYGNSEVFVKLVDMGANWKMKTNHLRSVLHLAAKTGNLPIVRTVVACGEVSSIVNDVDKDGLSSLNFAAMKGHVDVVKALLSNGAMIFRDSSGRTPLHNAALEGHADVIEAILDRFPKTRDHVDIDKNSPLHLAALADQGTAVSCLLRYGATVAPNNKGHTPLDLSISEKRYSVTTAFVTSSRWREFAKSSSEDYGTVLLGLTMCAPCAMKMVLDRCITRSEDISALDENYHISYDFTLLEPAVTPVDHNRPLPKLLEAISSSDQSKLITHPLLLALLERKWQLYGMYFHMIFTLIYLVFVSLLTYMQAGAVEQDLLPSLACRAYRNVERHKPSVLNSTGWQWFLNSSADGRHAVVPYHKINYGVTIAFCLFLALLIIKKCLEIHHKGWRYFMKSLNYLELSTFACCVVHVAGYLLREVECGVDSGHPNARDFTFQSGSLAIFLAWVTLLRYCEPYGGVGIYAVMFFNVLKTLLKTTLFFFVLALAFTLTFYELLPMLIFPDDVRFYMVNNDAESLNPRNLLMPFIEMHTANLQVFGMALGEFDAVSTFINPMLMKQLPFPVMTYIMLIVFYFLMTILLNNLLVALAIGDITATWDNASCLRLQCQINLHLVLENLMPKKYETYLRGKLQEYKYYPNRREPVLNRICRALGGGTKKGIMHGTFDETGHGSFQETKCHQNT